MIERVVAAFVAIVLLVVMNCPAYAEEEQQKEFALLYSMSGYAVNGTKHALLRQLSDSPSAEPHEWRLFRMGDSDNVAEFRSACDDLAGAEYIQWIIERCNEPVAAGEVKKEPDTFQVTVYSIDFNAVNEQGCYALITTLSDGSAFSSKPFVIAEKPLSQELLPALSIYSAQARFASGTFFGGFYDCNTKYGEAYSHGTYLNGLCNYWLYNRESLNTEDQATLQWAASVGFDYLMMLYKAKTGEIQYKAPERPGDAALNSGIHNSIEAVCGLAAYMDAFAGIDKERVNEENRAKILTTVSYIDSELQKTGNSRYHSEWKTSVLCHLYRAFNNSDDLEAARASAMVTLEAIDWEHDSRGNTISCFEGIWMLTQIDAGFCETPLLQEKIAVWKEDIQQILQFSAYGFPAFSGTWAVMPRLSLSEYNGSHNFYWVLNQRVIGFALDACFLWQLTGDKAFEQMAAGALYYVTGLNFGLPQDMCSVRTANNEPVTCASFASNSYGGVICWDLWMFMMQNDGWASIVNGYTFEDHDYLYTNSDWQHGETFIRMDGAMLYAASLYEMFVNQ